MYKKLKLRTKIIIPVFTIILIAILITWTIVFYILKWNFEKIYSIHLQSITEFKSKEIVVSEIYKKEIFDRVLIVMLWYLLSGLTVFIPMYYAVNFFIKYVTKPLTDLEKVAKEVEKGNLDIVIDVKETWDELEHLSRSFKDMLTKVRETDKEIRRQVFRQTRKIIAHQEETERLNLELRKFKQAVDDASDYITILNWEAKIVYVNKAFQRDLWYDLDEIINKNACGLCRKSNWTEKISDLWLQLWKWKEPIVREFVLIKKDRSEIISEAYITPILNEVWNIIFYLLVEHDITKDKEVERMKAEFLSIASHELRTPMTVIKWYASLLLEQKLWELNDNQKTYLGKIKDNSSNLIYIVNDMLDIWKLEADRMEINYWEFNLKEFINDLVYSFNPITKEKGLSIAGFADDITFVSDKSKLNQIFTNLIWNALKFTAVWGSIELISKVESDKIKFCVIDSGIWIKKEDLDKLFKKFSQIDSHLQRQVNGTWLWLVICKLIIEKLGWTISVESEIGKWSNFFFYLPLRQK